MVERYGETDLDALQSGIKDVVIDLLYCGDYRTKTRKKIQIAIAKNNLKKLTGLMGDRDYWIGEMGVPEDRFQRRNDALEAFKKE